MEWAHDPSIDPGGPVDLWALQEDRRIAWSIKRRFLIRASVEGDLVARGRVLERCATDPTAWINDWVWTYDPRLIERGLQPTIPLDMWPRQEQFVRWLLGLLRSGQAGVAEKCRDAGGTCIALAVMLHQWRFVEGFAGGVGSRKEELVDRKDDPDSLFEKLRFVLRWLPRWMLPPGFDLERHSSHRRLINPDNGSTITGEAGPNIGRGGRKTFYLVDEGAFLQHPMLVDAALSQAAPVQVWLSTPSEEGRASLFARKRFSGQYSVFEFDWRDDPRKDETWYEEQKRLYRYAPEIVRREIDRSYETTGEQHVLPSAWLDDLVGLRLPEDGHAVVGYDVADGGDNMNVAVGRRGPVLVECEAWPGDDHSYGVDRVIDMAERIGASEIRYDTIGVGAGPKTAFRTRQDRLRRLGIKVVGVNVGAGPSDLKYDGKPAKTLFRNLRTELWFALRRRVARARDFIRMTQEERARAPFGLDELFCVSDDVEHMTDITAQLGLLTYRAVEGGKVRLESKDELRARGFASPDFADGVVLAYADAASGAGASWLERMMR